MQQLGRAETALRFCRGTQHGGEPGLRDVSERSVPDRFLPDWLLPSQPVRLKAGVYVREEFFEAVESR